MPCLLGGILKKYKCKFSSPVVNPLLWMSYAVTFQVICTVTCYINFSSRGQCYIVDSKGACGEKRELSIKSFHAGNSRIRVIFHKLYFVKIKIYPVLT